MGASMNVENAVSKRIAAWNIAVKLQVCLPSPLAAKATQETLKAEVERIVIKC
jgi:hypothetical protein